MFRLALILRSSPNPGFRWSKALSETKFRDPPMVVRALTPLTSLSAPLLLIVRSPPMVVSPLNPFRLVIEPLLLIDTLPPTHWSFSRPVRFARVVLLRFRFP